MAAVVSARGASSGTRCKFQHVLATPPTQLPKKTNKKKSKKPKASVEQASEGPKDAIDVFFSQYSGFPYNRDASIRDEFYRLCDSRRWAPENPDRKIAWGCLRIAIVETFNSTFGDDLDDYDAWGRLCRLVGIDPVPSDIDERRQAVCRTHVNLLDLLTSTRMGKGVEIFPDEEQLREYTIATRKFFPKEEAYEGGILKYLLREILHEYNGRRGKDFGKKKGRKRR